MYRDGFIKRLSGLYGLFIVFAGSILVSHPCLAAERLSPSRASEFMWLPESPDHPDVHVAFRGRFELQSLSKLLELPGTPPGWTANTSPKAPPVFPRITPSIRKP